MSETVIDGALDLLLGGTCIGCGKPGRMLCSGCRDELPTGAAPAWPAVVPNGLVEPWATGPYRGTVRAMILGFKERQQWGLVAPLSKLLATAVASDLARAGPLVLVPVPSRACVVRTRGYDSTRMLAVRAGWHLARAGFAARALSLLKVSGRVADQAGLDRLQRQHNLAGSMRPRRAAVNRLRRRVTQPRIVICDDVLTTGSTVREAQRVLEEAGLPVARIAVVAATERRPEPDRANLEEMRDKRRELMT